MNTENYIFRQIKLEKELNKIKKKIHSDMGKEQLRLLLPYEQFLRNALKDQNDKDIELDDEEEELKSIEEEGQQYTGRSEPHVVEIESVDDNIKQNLDIKFQHSELQPESKNIKEII